MPIMETLDDSDAAVADGDHRPPLRRFYRPTAPFRQAITTVVGALLIASGVMCIIACEPSVREYVVTLYVMMAGGVVVLLEQAEERMAQYMPFLVDGPNAKSAKGWFYLLVGGLGMGSNWWQFSTALAMIVVAVWHISTPVVGITYRSGNSIVSRGREGPDAMHLNSV